MNGSLQITRLFGIPLRIHWTFALIIVWMFWVSLGSDGVFRFDYLLGMLWKVFILFTCVVLHELGHALMARRFGVNTRSILLLPIGGLAMLTRLPEKPIQEFLVAIAGPLVNIAIAILGVPLLLMVGVEKMSRLFAYAVNPGGNVFIYDFSQFEVVVAWIIGLNLILAIFNLIPAFPMDGGRILRSLLAIRMDRLQATKIASFVGQGLAIGVIAYTLLLGNTNWNLILIAGFVYITARNEYRAIRDTASLDKFSVGDIYRTVYTKLYLNDPVQKGFDLLEQKIEGNFLIFDEWQNLKGIISTPKLIELSKKDQLNESCEMHMQEKYEYVRPEMPISSVLSNMQQQQAFIYPVIDRYDTIIGVVDINLIYALISRERKGAQTASA